MQVELTLGQDDPDALHALRGWLANEPELRGVVHLRGTPRPEEMGALGDALVVAVSSGGALTVLARSLREWLAQPRGADVQIWMRTADGREIAASAQRLSDPGAFVREMLGDASGA